MTQDIVREIQEYLRTLSFYNPRLLSLSVDGVYGDETKQAVTFFQQEYGLPVSGDVDAKTWAHLVQAVHLLQDTAVLPLRIFADEKHQLRPGETTQLVPFLQLVLKRLSAMYSNIPQATMSGVYDEQTVDAVRVIQDLHALEQNGIVDRTTWNVLAQLYNNPTDTRFSQEG